MFCAKHWMDAKNDRAIDRDRQVNAISIAVATDCAGS